MNVPHIRHVFSTSLLAVLVGLFTTSVRAGEIPRIFTGNDLLAICSAITAIDTRHLNQDDIDRLRSCRGFLDGFEQGRLIGALSAAAYTSHKLAESMNITTRVLSRTYCVPDTATFGQVGRVLVKYLRDHPKYLNQPAGALTLAAFVDAFPCQPEK